MKKLLTLFAMLTLFVSMMAQTTPLNYQAVLRDPTTNELVRNQSVTAVVTVPLIIDNQQETLFEGTVVTNSDGMLNLPLTASNNVNWAYVREIVAEFTYEIGTQEKNIRIVTPVTPVPFAFHTDGSYLTTDHIVNYINSDIDGTDIDTIYKTLQDNEAMYNGMRDSIVKYIKENYEKAKEIGYHYLFLITATDLNQFYHEGQTIDQEVKDSIYSMAKKFLKDNRAMLVELAKYYAETASAAEVNQLYNELLSNSTASAKIRELLYSYFDAYLVRKGLDGCNLCDIYNRFDPNVTPPAVPASVELLGHGITSSVLYGYLRVGNTTLDQGDVTLQADGSNHIFIPTLEAANLANGSAITYHHYRFTIPYSELAQQIGEQNLAHGLSLRCTLKIKHGEDLDKTIESPFDIDIDCPSPVVTDGQFELTLENAYVGEFTYTGGSSNVTVTGKWSDSNGEHQFNMTDNSPALTIDKTTKKVSVVIPNDSVILEVASQLYVTVTLKDINCEDTTVWASYVSGQLLCPTVGAISAVLVEENMLTLSTNVDLYDPSVVDYVRYAISYGEGDDVQINYITGDNITINGSSFIADYNLSELPDTLFSIWFELKGKGECTGEFYSDTVYYPCPSLGATEIQLSNGNLIVHTDIINAEAGVIYENLCGYKVFVDNNSYLDLSAVNFPEGVIEVKVDLSDHILQCVIPVDSLKKFLGNPSVVYFEPYLAMICGDDPEGTMLTGEAKAYNGLWGCGQSIWIGNEKYGTTQFGNVCWMTENMRNVPTGATRISDGRYNPDWEFHSTTSEVTSEVNAYYYYPQNNADYVANYGLLYNWLAATAGENINQEAGYIQGICPEGWRMPVFADIPQPGVNTAFDEFFAGANTPKPGWVSPSGLAPDFNVALVLWSVNFFKADEQDPGQYVPSVISSNINNTTHKYSGMTNVSKAGAYSVRCVKTMAQ